MTADRTPGDAQTTFDELARVVLADHSRESVLEGIAELAQGVIPGADDVSVSLIGVDGASTVVFTGDVAQDLDETQYDDGSGPCLDAATGGQTAMRSRAVIDQAKRILMAQRPLLPPGGLRPAGVAVAAVQPQAPGRGRGPRRGEAGDSSPQVG